MALPVLPLATGTAQVGGEAVPIKALSRADVLTLLNMFTGDPNAAETFVVSRGCGVSEDVAREWLQNTGTTIGRDLVDDILVLSDVVKPDEVEDAPDPKPDTSEPS